MRGRARVHLLFEPWVLGRHRVGGEQNEQEADAPADREVVRVAHEQLESDKADDAVPDGVAAPEQHILDGRDEHDRELGHHLELVDVLHQHVPIVLMARHAALLGEDGVAAVACALEGNEVGGRLAEVAEHSRALRFERHREAQPHRAILLRVLRVDVSVSQSEPAVVLGAADESAEGDGDSADMIVAVAEHAFLSFGRGGVDVLAAPLPGQGARLLIRLHRRGARLLVLHAAVEVIDAHVEDRVRLDDSELEGAKAVPVGRAPPRIE